MKNYLTLVAMGMAVCAISASGQTLPVAPETAGLMPKTATGWINGTNGINNFSSEALSLDMANNGNVIIGWEDDAEGTINHFLGVWTMVDGNGNMITPMTVQTNRDTTGDLGTLESTTNQYLSFFRSDDTATPGFPGGWGPKVRANRFGNGMGMGAMPWAIGLEIPELYEINADAGGPPPASDDFPCVQLLNNDGTPLRLGPISGITNLGIVTLADEDVEPAGAIRLGGWDYLSSGNIVIVGESRQAADRALTGQASGNTPVYRIVTPGGLQVKGYSAVSATAESGSISRNGAAAVVGGFAIRWQGAGGATVRLFDNAGNPTTGNLDLATLTGHPEASGGGNGGNAGINSNGKDAYVLVGDFGGNTVWVTVLNADGSVRWSRSVADDLTISGLSGTSAAIDLGGQVVVVFSASPDPTLSQGIMGRRFDAEGNPIGGTFYVGETEIPDFSNPPFFASDSPKVAWRNGTIAVAWFSKNYVDPSLLGIRTIAYRYFVPTLPDPPETAGLMPKTATGWINGTNGINNFSSEALSLDMANNGNVIIGWEDDAEGTINHFLGVWTMVDGNGNMITPMTVQTNRDTTGDLGTLESTTNQYLSFFRSDDTATPGFPGGWGPKVRANRFGNGMGMGAMPWAIGLEIPELYEINADAGGPPPASDDFPCVQLLNNDGTPLRLGPISGITNLGIVTLADEDVEPAGAIRLGGWDYLSSGNIVIVGESRQAADRALTGQASGNTPVYRIVTPGGLQVKGYSAVSATAESGSISRNGAAAVVGGFAIRWQGAGGATVRLFDNAGNPTTGNLDLATLTGHPEASGGGNGGNAGINSNGKDAYVLVGDFGGNTVWVTVLNADGSVRWSRNAADDKVLTGFNGTSAAIDELGQVVVVFSARLDPTMSQAIMGRRFDAEGNPVGGTFYVGETEIPSFDSVLWDSDSPKVAWRDGSVAVTWFSKNYVDPSLQGIRTIAYRLFLSGTPSGPSLSISSSGANVTISWPADVTGFTLESSPVLGAGAVWTAVPGVVNNSVVVTATGTRFYRLKQ